MAFLSRIHGMVFQDNRGRYSRCGLIALWRHETFSTVILLLTFLNSTVAVPSGEAGHLEANSGRYGCDEYGLVSAGVVSCLADVRRVSCFLCGRGASLRCDQCSRPVCGGHSMPFSIRRGRVVSIACQPCFRTHRDDPFRSAEAALEDDIALMQKTVVSSTKAPVTI